MTKDNPVAAGVAKAISQDILDAAHDYAFDCAPPASCDDIAAIFARAIVAERNRAASPVQAGIDPLVAEIRPLEQFVGLFSSGAQGAEMDCDSAASTAIAIAKLIAGYRSQAERIAALEEAETAKDIEHRAQLCEMSERFRAVNIQRVIEASGDDILAMRERIAALEVERDDLIRVKTDAVERLEQAEEKLSVTRRNCEEASKRTYAAESLLAEAREALEVIKKRVTGDSHPNWSDDYPVICSRMFIADVCDATLSRLKPGEKGGE